MLFHIIYKKYYIWILLSLLLYSKNSLGKEEEENSTTAYVTLLYNENFLLGVRVLGQSIKKFNNQRYFFSTLN